MATACVIIDVQQKILSVMNDPTQTETRLVQLIDGLRALDIPMILLEQYPQGLGPTAEKVQVALPGVTAIAKTTFSAYQHDTFVKALQAIDDLDRIILCGIEAHICVYQTARDLLEAGYIVEVVADAVDSRTADNKQLGIDRMAQEGALITSVEMVLFELLGHAKHPHFKTISNLIK